MDEKKDAGHYAWHACWHDDAWRGIELMPPDVVGVYWRIILLMYRKRAALPDDDATLAKVCLTSLKHYRRVKRVLIEAQRIEVDEENGLLYCTRAVKQLVRDARYREAQGRRGKKGGRPQLAIDNVVPLPVRDDGGLRADLEGDFGGDFPGDKSAPAVENIQKAKTTGKATYTYTHKESFLGGAASSRAAPKRAALPPRGGGAPDRKAWLADQAVRMGLAKQEGKDGDGVEAPGDRKARRRKR